GRRRDSCVEEPVQTRRDLHSGVLSSFSGVLEVNVAEAKHRGGPTRRPADALGAADAHRCGAEAQAARVPITRRSRIVRVGAGCPDSAATQAAGGTGSIGRTPASQTEGRGFEPV